MTLLYLGGGSDTEIASRHPHLQGPNDVARFRMNLANSEGIARTIQVTSVIWDGRIAAAEVIGLHDLCANLFPHVTLALAPRVPPRASNELLARKAATFSMQAGLGPWLTHHGLAAYQTSLLEWCKEVGAVTPDEVAENAEDAAAAIEKRE